MQCNRFEVQTNKPFVSIILPTVLAIVICLGLVLNFEKTANSTSKATEKPNKTTLISEHLSPYITSDNDINLSKALLSPDFITLFGSSELSTKSEYNSHRFIPKFTNKELVAYGSGGFQSLNILLALKANNEFLKNSNIVILLSPGWFVGSGADGLDPDYLIKTNTESSLNRLLQLAKQDKESTYYVAKRFYEMASSNKIKPSITMEQIINCSNKSNLEMIKGFPNSLTLSAKQKLKSFFRNSFSENSLEFTSHKEAVNAMQNLPTKKVDSFNYQSAKAKSKELLDSSCSTNNWGILDNYYLKYINGKHSTIDKGSIENNVEFEDYKQLLAFINRQNIPAVFVMQPLNPFYYKNLKELTPTLEAVKAEADKYNYPFLDPLGLTYMSHLQISYYTL